MKKRRDKDNLGDLCSGSAKLVQALRVTKLDYGKPLYKGNLFINQRDRIPESIASGPRVGIKQAVDKPWRFWVKDNQFVSV